MTVDEETDGPDGPRETGLNINDASTWPEVLTVEEVAAILRLTTQTVYKRIADGTIPTTQVLGRDVKRISKARLLKIIYGS